MSRKPARRCGPDVSHAPAPEAFAVVKSDNSGCRGWTLLKLRLVAAFIDLILKMAVPLYHDTIGRGHGVPAELAEWAAS